MLRGAIRARESEFNGERIGGRTEKAGGAFCRGRKGERV
jgi:hypothetical protein